MLTQQEIDLVHDIGEVWTQFGRLEVMHPDDAPEFTIHIHALQNIIMARAAQRAHPEDFPPKRGT